MNNRYLKISIIIIITLVITLVFVACQTTNKEDKPQYEGIITAINNNALSLDIITKDSGLSDKTVLKITEDTKYEKDLPKQFAIGQIITFTTTGQVLESYPTRSTAVRIISIEEPSRIAIDERETISGLFEGKFPMYVIYATADIRGETSIEKGEFFVIKLDENPSTGYVWKLKENDNFKIVGNGYLPTPTQKNMVGSGGHVYYGFIGVKKGMYTIEFDLYSPAGQIDTTRNINIEVK